MKKRTQIYMNKINNSQDSMEKMLAIALLQAVKDMSETQETSGIPENGLTIVIGNVGMDNREFKLSICLTPIDVFSEFLKTTAILN